MNTLSAQVLSAAQPPSNTVQIEGTLAIAHADDFANNRSHFAYEVRDDAGGATVLNVSTLPSDVHGGSRVLVSGKRGPDGLSLDPETITVESDATGASATTSGLVAKSATTSSVLVILANFNNTAAPSYTASQALQVMATDPGSVANFYSEASYGSQLLSVTVTSTWVTMNLAPTCSYTSISSAANSAAQALNALYTASNYNFVVYLFPAQSCGWAGLAYVGSPHQAFINGTGSFVTQVVAHEMGHNFGLLHAGSLSCGAAAIGGSCSVAEYGDPWDTMGNQRAMHFNAPQKSLLGWLPASSIITHSSGSANYTLSPLETAGGSVYAVKIPTSNTSRTYWVEFRQPIGFDAPLASYPNNGAQVRLGSPFEWASGSDDTEIVDMTPGSGGGFGDSALVVGQSYLDSTYGVNIIVTGATSSALTVNVTTGGSSATTTTLASSANPSTAGSAITLTATVTGSSPTGSVNFLDGGASISGCGAVALAGSGNARTAVCATSALATGTHSIVASYGGDAANSGSTSATLSQTVNGATSTTGVATSLTPATVGTSITFTATVSGSSPTGTVNFRDGSTSISGCSASSVGGSGNIRTATCGTNALATGSHSVSAVYSGDAMNGGSTSSALTETVNQTSSSTSLSSSANPSVAGASVTFTASVAGFSPSGTVNFSDGGVSISGCSAVTLGGSGNTRTAQCSTSALTAATHSIAAAYVGDVNNTSSTSGTLSQVVNNATASTSLSSSANPSTVGSSVTFTATVTGSNPTGTVNFTDGGISISGCSAVAVSGSGNARTAACSTSGLASGSHSVVAGYSGDAVNAASTSAPLSQTVNKTSSSTGVATSQTPSIQGAMVSFTATVSGNAPTGSVNFMDGGSSITGCGTATVAGTGNVRTATCNTSSLSVGTHSITAAYGGDSNNNGSTSSVLSQAVNTGGSGAGGIPVWVEDAVPTGATQASDGGDAWTWVSSNPPPFSGAQAHQSALSAGEHQHYFYNATTTLSVAAGDGLFAYVYLDPANPPSEVMLQWNDGSWEHRAYWGANLIAWGVDGTASRINMGALPPAGQWVKLSVPAALLGLEGHTLNGMAFTLYDGRATWDYAGTAASGSTTYQLSGTVTLNGAALSGVNFGASNGGSCGTSNASGSYSCTVPQGWSGTVTPSLSGYTFAPTSLSYNNLAANQTIQNYAAASSSGSVSTTLASSSNPARPGRKVTFTATATGSNPTGTVAFTSDGTTITNCGSVALSGSGNSKTAKCATSFNTGTYTVVATYSGDANNANAASAPLSQVVKKR